MKGAIIWSKSRSLYNIANLGNGYMNASQVVEFLRGWRYSDEVKSVKAQCTHIWSNGLSACCEPWDNSEGRWTRCDACDTFIRLTKPAPMQYREPRKWIDA